MRPKSNSHHLGSRHTYVISAVREKIVYIYTFTGFQNILGKTYQLNTSVFSIEYLFSLSLNN